MSEASPSFLNTKISIPRLVEHSVQRPRLLNRLEESVRRGKLTLISASAGYGKSTLVRQWLEFTRNQIHPIWLSLDAADNHPPRFLTCLIAAIQSMIPCWGKTIQSWAMLPEFPPLEILTTELIKEIEFNEPFLLVLDDYHQIHQPLIHTLIESLIVKTPPGFHIILLTREDPPIGLGRLRAQRQLLELRGSDLSFTEVETLQFLCESMALNLNKKQAQTLCQKTEGWIAGLQLAAISLQTLPSPQEFINQFRGTHRFIIDYLVEEVLRNQSPAVRDFLSRVSLLPRFNAELCKAVLEEGTGEFQQVSPEQILAYLERSNLFLIALDEQREWYRFHHLFAEFLQTERSTAERQAILRKAANWFLSAGFPEESIQCALAASDMPLAADIIQAVAFGSQSWTGGYYNVILDWINRLPEQEIFIRPRLSLLAARTWFLSGNFKQAGWFIENAQQAIMQNSHTPAMDGLKAELLLHQATFAGHAGQIKQAIELAQKALALLPSNDFVSRARAQHAMAVANALRGDFSAAQAALAECIQLSRNQGLAITAAGQQVQLLLYQGELQAAEETAKSTISLCEAEQGLTAPSVGYVHAALAETFLDQFRLEEAQSEITKALELSKQGQIAESLRYSWWVQALIYIHGGRWAEAETALRQLEVYTLNFHVPRLQAQYEMIRLFLFVMQGRVEVALRLVESMTIEEPVQYIRDLEILTIARVLLAANQAQRAAALLDELCRQTAQAGRLRSQVEALTLYSLALQQQSQEENALKSLQEAVGLAAPRGFLRPFACEVGLPVLLEKIRPAAPDFLAPLLENPNRTLCKEQQFISTLPDPLTPREIEVLRLITAGLTNPEIAEKLFLTEGTVKWYVHQIFGKLGVSNRAKAIVRARSLKLD